MKNLHGKAYNDFVKKYWWARLLPLKYFNLLALRWFNMHTKIWVDITNWDGKFDWDVSMHNSWDVFLSEYNPTNRPSDYDLVLSQALWKASELYN